MNAFVTLVYLLTYSLTHSHSHIAEQSKAEQSKAKQSRAKQSRAEQSKAEQQGLISIHPLIKLTNPNFAMPCQSTPRPHHNEPRGELACVNKYITPEPSNNISPMTLERMRFIDLTTADDAMIILRSPVLYAEHSSSSVLLWRCRRVTRLCWAG
jgi:hypothetical protein